MRTVPLLVLVILAATSRPAHALEITDWPIRFDEERVRLTLAYIKQHYGLSPKDVRIEPRAIVIHWTGGSSLKGVWRGFNRVRMRSTRRYLLRGGLVNVSAHFLVGRDGKVYRLMPETWMARHCIGLNYDAIGIENVGDGKRYPLTKAQLAANAALVRYLVSRYPKIRYVLGHLEWKRFERAPFFRELDPTYRNAKADPGRRFMRALRDQIKSLKLQGSYKSTQR